VGKQRNSANNQSHQTMCLVICAVISVHRCNILYNALYFVMSLIVTFCTDVKIHNNVLEYMYHMFLLSL